MSFTAFLHQHFIGPLQMNHTKTSQDALEDYQLAAAYSPLYKGQLPNVLDNTIGEGGILSTAEDMARFSQLFMGQANDVLSDKSARAMEQNEYKRGFWPEEKDDTGNYYGLGWDSVKPYPFTEYGIKALSKGGDIATYHASLVVLPEKKMAAAVLTSEGSSSNNQLLAHQLLLHALKEKGEIKDIKPDKPFGEPFKAKMPKDVVTQAGYYARNLSQFRIDITEDGELSMTSDPEEKYVYTSDGTFVNKNGTTKVSFVTEKNGRTYLWKRNYQTLQGLGQEATSEYVAEKLEDNVLPKETADAWAKREGATYYLVNEKHSSDMYFFSHPTMQISVANGLPGYWEDKKITGPNTATSEIQIPGVDGLDTTETHFYKKDGIEYMKINAYSFVSEAKVKGIYVGNHSTTTISASGDANWFTIPETVAGKTMTVGLPTKNAFVVYDENGVCINHSLVSNNNKVTLPKNGSIVFIGTPGSEFKIAMR